MGSGAAGGMWSSGQQQSSKPGVINQLTRQFGGEIEMLKTAAVTGLLGIIRDTVRQNFPSMHQEMERMRRDQGTTGYSSSMGSSSMGGSSMGGSSMGGSSMGGSSMGSSSMGGSSGSDYAHSAVNNPSHVTGSYDPDRSSGSRSYESKTGYPDEDRHNNPSI
jgi:hypothetical protein